jgi:hypothetical protein
VLLLLLSACLHRVFSTTSTVLLQDVENQNAAEIALAHQSSSLHSIGSTMSQGVSKADGTMRSVAGSNSNISGVGGTDTGTHTHNARMGVTPTAAAAAQARLERSHLRHQQMQQEGKNNANMNRANRAPAIPGSANHSYRSNSSYSSNNIRSQSPIISRYGGGGSNASSNRSSHSVSAHSYSSHTAAAAAAGGGGVTKIKSGGASIRGRGRDIPTLTPFSRVMVLDSSVKNRKMTATLLSMIGVKVRKKYFLYYYHRLLLF